MNFVQIDWHWLYFYLSVAKVGRGVFEAGSGVRVEYCTSGKVSVFRGCLANIGGVFILAGGLGAGHSFYGV